MLVCLVESPVVSVSLFLPVGIIHMLLILRSTSYSISLLGHLPLTSLIFLFLDVADCILQKWLQYFCPHDFPEPFYPIFLKGVEFMLCLLDLGEPL